MAETKETVLIDIKLDQDEGAFQKLAGLKGTLSGLKTEQKALETALKSGAITQKEYNSEIVRVEALQKKAQASYNETQRSVTGLKNPLQSINEKLNSQSDTLNKIVPGLGSMVNAFNNLGTAAKSLWVSLGPLALVLGAIGIVVGALTAYFKGSEEGQNRLNKIVAIGTVIFEKFMDVVEAVGKAIFDAGAWIADFVIAGTGLSVTFAEIDASAQKLADNEAKRDKQERELIESRSKTRLEVARLRKAADESEGKERADFIKRAIALEFELSDKELALAKTRQEIAQQKKDQFGDDKDALKELAEANAALSDAESSALEGTRKLNKERVALDKELAEQAKFNRDLAKAERHADSEDLVTEDRRIADLRLETETKLTGGLEGLRRHMVDVVDETNESIAKSDEAGLEQQRQVTLAKAGLARQLGQALVQFAGKNRELAVFGTIVERVAAISQIISNTGIANAKAIATSPLTLGLPWTALNTASAALSIGTVIAGAAQAIGQINSTPGFATSGQVLSGKRIGSGDGSAINRSNGDNRLVTAKVGEVILNERHQAMLGGSDTFARIGVPGFALSGLVTPTTSNFPSNETAILRDIVRKMDSFRPVLVVENVTDLQSQQVEVREKATL